VLVLRYGDAAAVARLAARLDETPSLPTPELHCAAVAARRSGGVGAAGVAVLERAVRDAAAGVAADAAAAMLESDPEAGARALRARVLRHLAQAERVEGTGTEAAIFELRAGPLPEELRERMRAAEDPLVAACVCEDPVARVRPLLARGLGRREAYRVEILGRLLRRRDATEADRVLFATSAVASEVAFARRAGLEALRGTAPAAWEALRPIVTAALADADEPTRLFAAALLLPDPRALEVCADALYDGDPWAARRVAAMLAEAKAGACDPRAPVAERRRASADLRRRALRGGP
jgi:hypothetical protein